MSTSYQALCRVPVPQSNADTMHLSTARSTDREASQIVGESDSMQKLRTQVRRLGPHFRTVLVRGEVGTGKELVGRTLHSFSSHAAGPFVVFDAAPGANAARDHVICAPADSDMASLLRTAHRGTLYINQVGELSPSGQADLLTELKSRDRARGRIMVHGLEARIVVSTTENLRVLAASGRFLEELYARLATLEIELPPLRERREDIAALADYFVERYARRYGKQVDGISAEALDRMEAYAWPGNTGEMKKLLRRAVVECRSEMIEEVDIKITVEESPPASSAPGATARLQEVVEQHVFQVLKECAGNKVRAAEMLGISRSTLYRMLDAGLQGDKLVGLR